MPRASITPIEAHRARSPSGTAAAREPEPAPAPADSSPTSSAPQGTAPPSDSMYLYSRRLQRIGAAGTQPIVPASDRRWASTDGDPAAAQATSPGGHSPTRRQEVRGRKRRRRRARCGTVGVVSWSPTSRDPPDPRLDLCRNRVASLHESGALVGYVLVLTKYWSTQIGGYLWWRRWEPESEIAQPQVQLLDGTWWDYVVLDEDLDQELESWTRRRFELSSTRTLDMVWLSEQESIELGHTIFDLEYCEDNDGHPYWL